MHHLSLASLGWSDHFARQLAPGERPARIAELHRGHLGLLSPEGPLRLPSSPAAAGLAVGDWVVHDGTRLLRRLAPRTLIARRAAGTSGESQPIVANVDVLGIVTSCNADFSPGRLERYLALALGAGCLPLAILTKADLCPDPRPYLRQAQALSPALAVLALDATDPAAAERLLPWAGPGQTLALTGSSGVGKTTLQNALTGVEALTQGIREDDARGRHTTTARVLRPTLAGGCLIDTPGMRELGLAEAALGVESVFADVTDLARDCRFADCGHDSEPGCAVKAAIADGRLDPARLTRWRKLAREERANTETLHERHARARAFSRATRDGRDRGRWKRAGPEGD